MKKLFSRAKKPVQTWETWEDSSGNEYDWDRAEDADEMPAEEEPDAGYAGETGRYRRRGGRKSAGYAGGLRRRSGLEEEESELPEDGNTGFGWQEDEIEEAEETEAGGNVPGEAVEAVWADAGYDEPGEADAGGDGEQEESDGGYYGQEEPDGGYYEQEESDAGYYGQEESDGGYYRQEEPDGGYYGQEEPDGGYHEQEESDAGYYEQEAAESGDYEQEDAGAAYGQRKAGYDTEEEAGNVFYGQEEPDTKYYGREDTEAASYGQEMPDTASYGQETSEAVFYRQEMPDMVSYGQETSDTASYRQEMPDTASYGQETSGAASYRQKVPDRIYYGQEGGDAASYGQEESNTAYYGQEEPDAAYYGQEEPDTAYYEQEESDAVYYGQEEPDAIAYGRQEEFAGYQEDAGRGGELYQEDPSWDGESYQEDPGRDGEFYPEQEVSYEEEAYAEPPVRKRERRRTEQEEAPEEGILERFAKSLRGMELMDKVMLATGALVLILAVVTVAVFASARMVQNQVADFANVGLQLEGISTIGEKGLMAVANAQLERIASISEAATPEPQQPEEPKKDYNEVGYDRQVSVEPGFTSIQKDLKIKFINTKTDKLVPNVPFSVTVTGPDGKTLIWSDDDMDGIIYKQDITPGTYQVAMETLTDSRYAGYTISTSAKSVEVKKEISYNKVDVANEVKKESEVNAAKEDTRKNETVVESSLQDTVAWVESKTIAAAYSEVPKSAIPDPATLTIAGIFRRIGGVELLSQDQMDPQTDASQIPGGAQTEPQPPAEATQAPADEPTQAPWAEPTLAPTEVPTQVPTAEPTLTPTEVPTQVPTAEPTLAPTEVPTQIPTAEPTMVPTAVPTLVPTPVPTLMPSPTPIVTPVPMRGSLTIDHTDLSGGTGAVLTAKASAGGFDPGRTVFYSAVTNNPAVATATVDMNGNITVYTVAAGTAVITVTANYEGGGAETAASAGINVAVGGGVTLSLDSSALTMSVQASAAIHAAIANSAAQDPSVRAESSDTNVAVVSVDKKTVTITGVGEGTAVITVKYAENGSEASASCTVTVKKGPREDRTTRLKDAEGRQLYVVDNNTYREAVYADYYTAEKFFIRGEAKYTGWQTIDGRLYYFTADGGKVTGEQVIQGAKYNFASDGSLVTGDGTLGIDVSKWNGTIDWNAVKNSGVSYVIIRCGYRGSSEGKLIEDPKFEANIKGAAAAGLKVGVYFFTQAVNEIEAVEEASMVLEQIRNYRISYPVFLDVEASGGRGDGLDKSTRTAVCRAFCQTIQNAGYTAGIYANKQWLEGKLDAGSLGSFKIWLAQYAAAPTYTGRYDMWQYKATGSISGISGNVDLNISYLGY